MKKMSFEKSKNNIYKFLVFSYRMINPIFWKNTTFKWIATKIYNSNLISNLKSMQGRPQIRVDQASLKELANSKDDLLILSGKNNSWKSFILRELHKTLEKSYYLASSRFYNLNQLNPNQLQEDFYKSSYTNSVININNASQNQDNNSLDINSIINWLENEDRIKLFKLAKDLIWEPFGIKDFNEKNELSWKYIDVNWYNLSWSSSWTRLLIVILWVLLNKNYEYVLLDEPEIGLSPKIQNALMNMLVDKNIREEYFSHLKKVVIATHSHVFLHKESLESNYIVAKEDDLVKTKQINDIKELHNLTFNLLGNTFESLFLPSFFILVEWVSDEKYIKKVLATKYKNLSFIVINCLNDDWVRRNAEILKNMVWDFQYSPYKNRIYAIFDSIRLPNAEWFLLKKWFNQNNIILWWENWIEFYYPEDILKKIYKFTWDNIYSKLNFEWDRITLNWVSYTKNDLADKVVEMISEKIVYNEEFNSKFLSKLEKVLT